MENSRKPGLETRGGRVATPVAREGRARTPPMGEARGLSNVCPLILPRRSRRSAAHPTGRAPAGSSQQCKYGERLQEGGRRWRATTCVQPPPGFGRRRATEAHLALPTPTSAGGRSLPGPQGFRREPGKPTHPREGSWAARVVPLGFREGEKRSPLA